VDVLTFGTFRFIHTKRLHMTSTDLKTFRPCKPLPILAVSPTACCYLYLKYSSAKWHNAFALSATSRVKKSCSFSTHTLVTRNEKHVLVIQLSRPASWCGISLKSMYLLLNPSRKCPNICSYSYGRDSCSNFGRLAIFDVHCCKHVHTTPFK
jgi:hypothetical protein